VSYSAISAGLSGVDREVIELLADETPVDAEVDSEVTVLLVTLSPVDSEPMPVEVDVEKMDCVISLRYLLALRRIRPPRD
jgi:hypothetical protein